ncbi:GDSL-type esterase/lipase family protein [Streptomyces sp. NPDC088560]|uniref:GDSL-type esterase/lipase family protein n=1 Tax=Streptomyces sp. NPDC088560 TaxID=3365868 RepID=UPI00380A380E
MPTQVDPTCLRSDQNFPSLVSRSRAATLTDVGCSGASTADMTASRGAVSPRFDAPSRGTDLVTMAVGGNDAGFSTVLGTCAQLMSADPVGMPCQYHYSGDGTDQISGAIAKTAPKIAQVPRGIHHRAPHACVVVGGYRSSPRMEWAAPAARCHSPREICPGCGTRRGNSTRCRLGRHVTAGLDT